MEIKLLPNEILEGCPFMVKFESVQSRWVIVKYGKSIKIHDTCKTLFINPHRNNTKLIILNFRRKINVININLKITSFNIVTIPNLNYNFKPVINNIKSALSNLKTVFKRTKPVIKKLKPITNNFNLIPEIIRLKY